MHTSSSQSQTQLHQLQKFPKLSKNEVRQKIRKYRQEIKDLRDRHQFEKDFIYDEIMNDHDRARLRTLSEKIHSLREYGDEHYLFQLAGEKAGLTRKIHDLEQEIAALKKERESLG